MSIIYYRYTDSVDEHDLNIPTPRMEDLIGYRICKDSMKSVRRKAYDKLKKHYKKELKNLNDTTYFDLLNGTTWIICKDFMWFEDWQPIMFKFLEKNGHKLRLLTDDQTTLENHNI